MNQKTNQKMHNELKILDLILNIFEWIFYEAHFIWRFTMLSKLNNQLATYRWNKYYKNDTTTTG